MSDTNNTIYNDDIYKNQERTYFHDIGGFSFNAKTSEDTEKDLKIFNDTLDKVVSKIPDFSKERLSLLKNLSDNIQKGKIFFNNGLTEQKVFNIINLSLSDIHDLVTGDKKDIFAKLFCFPEDDEDNALNPQMVNMLKDNGLTEKDIYEEFSVIYSLMLVKRMFITQNQYMLLFDGEMKNLDIDNIKEIKKTEKKLEQILDEKQKETISKYKLKYSDLARAIIFYGRYATYRVSYLKTILPKVHFNKENLDRLKEILKGNSKIYINEKNIIDCVDKTFTPYNKNLLKKNDVKFLKIFENHDYMINLLQEASKRNIKIPKILVNFDSHSDLFINSGTKRTLADWVNTAVAEHDITDVYWVFPSRGFYYKEFINNFYGDGIIKDKVFFGNYKTNYVHTDFKKPLTQTFLVNKQNGYLISESANYPKEKINEHLKESKYKLVNVHTCTKDILPKFKENFILSIDADFFNCNGFDSNFWIEQMPYNVNYILNDFLKFWDKNLNKASILGLCLSPEYIGLDSLDITKSFYNYISDVILEKI